MDQVVNVADVYDGHASYYEAGLSRFGKYFSPEWIARYAQDVHGLAECRVLDLGCGTGFSVKLLRDQIGGVRADGIDISGEMLKHARTSGRYERLHQHDLHKPLVDVPSDTYDLVIAFGCLDHLSQVHICLSECARVLKNDGILWASFRRFEADDEGSPPRRAMMGDLVVTGYSAAEILHMAKIRDLRVIALDPIIGYITRTGFPCPYYGLRARKTPASDRAEAIE